MCQTLDVSCNHDTVRHPGIAALLQSLDHSEPKTCVPLVEAGCQVLKEFYGHPSAKQDFVPDSREAGHLVLDARWGLRRVHPQSCRLHLLLALPVSAGEPSPRARA